MILFEQILNEIAIIDEDLKTLARDIGNFCTERPKYNDALMICNKVLQTGEKEPFLKFLESDNFKEIYNKMSKENYPGFEELFKKVKNKFGSQQTKTNNNNNGQQNANGQQQKANEKKPNAAISYNNLIYLLDSAISAKSDKIGNSLKQCFIPGKINIIYFNNNNHDNVITDGKYIYALSVYQNPEGHAIIGLIDNDEISKIVKAQQFPRNAKNIPEIISNAIKTITYNDVFINDKNEQLKVMIGQPLSDEIKSNSQHNEKDFEGINDIYGKVMKCLKDGKNNLIFGYIDPKAKSELDRNKLAKIENIKKMYAKHPYASRVVDRAEEFMKGSKYISVGNPAYRQAESYFKRKANLILRELREDGSFDAVKGVSDSMIKTGINLIDRIYKTPENMKWQDEDFLKVVKAAKKGDQSAIGYLMYKHGPAIMNAYWKNFLGPNPKMRKIRIEEDGGLKSSILGWIGMCLKALVKGGVDMPLKKGGERSRMSTLEGFKPSAVTGKPENAFSSRFRMDIMTQAIDYNLIHSKNGITNSDDEEITTTNLEFDNGRERDGGEDETFMRDDLEDSVLDKMSDDDFLDDWKDYCQDDTLNDGKKCTPAKAFWKILTNPDATNLKKLADECGVSRGNFEMLAQKAVSLLPKYGIEYRTLMNACDRYGVKKVASYLMH